MGILFSGDYNPEQWPREVWDEDMELFRVASVNTVTINVFAWALLQKSENEYNFTELDEIVRRHAQAGHHIIMATSTSTVPAWLARKYPEVLRTDYHGVHKKIGKRHNFCPNSPVYRQYAGMLVQRLAVRYKNERAIKYWHIGNEFEGECYCENCERAFRIWLKEKYQTIEALNAAWDIAFWNHRFYDWDEIVLPNDLGDGEAGRAFMSAIKLDYARFNSDSQLACYKAERDIIRGTIPNAKCTTNLMGTYRTMDYFRWTREMKRIGDKTVGSTVRGQVAIVFDWDSYQALEMCIGPNKDLRYVPEVWRFYDALYRRHIPVDFIPADAGVDKLAAYPLVLCPVLYMVQGDTAERLAAYVRQGGTLVTGYMSGMADGNDRIYTGGYPGGCRTNVRQLILYIQHKTPSFEKPGVRGIISLCN